MAFRFGFPPRAASGSRNLLVHARGLRSDVLVSTSRDKYLAFKSAFPYGGSREPTWLYIIDADGGIDVERSIRPAAGVNARRPVLGSHEHEVAFVGGIRPENIVGARRIHGYRPRRPEDVAPTSDFINYGGTKIPLLGEMVYNPGYNPNAPNTNVPAGEDWLEPLDPTDDEVPPVFLVDGSDGGAGPVPPEPGAGSAIADGGERRAAASGSPRRRDPATESASVEEVAEGRSPRGESLGGARTPDDSEWSHNREGQPAMSTPEQGTAPSAASQSEADHAPGGDSDSGPEANTRGLRSGVPETVRPASRTSSVGSDWYLDADDVAAMTHEPRSHGQDPPSHEAARHGMAAAAAHPEAMSTRSDSVADSPVRSQPAPTRAVAAGRASDGELRTGGADPARVGTHGRWGRGARSC